MPAVLKSRLASEDDTRALDTCPPARGNVGTPIKREGERQDANSAGHYYRCFATAADEGNDSAMNVLVKDMLCKFRGSEKEKREFVSWALFNADFARFRGQTVLDMLNFLERSSGVRNLSPQDFKYLAIQISTRLHPSAADQALVNVIFMPVLSELQKVGVVPGGGYGVTHYPPQIVYLAFALLSKLLAVDDHEKALQLFRLLFERSYIPPESVQATPTSSQNFKLIMSLTAARACIHWGYRTFAHRLIIGILPSGPDTQQSPAGSEATSLATDFLYSTLTSPRRPEFSSCIDLIIRLHPVSPVENGIIRTAYACAAQHNYAHDATRLYAFTRQLDDGTKQLYPAPQNDQLLWLLKYMAAERGLTHLARTLVTEVTEQAIFLPVRLRADFIATVASQGFATCARKLWERYSTGKDRQTIVGSAAVMVRMMSLFSSLIRQKEEALVELEQRHSGAAFLDNQDDRVLEERISDLVRFVDKVLSEFVRSHEPLESAQHENLTSLARAYFIMGDVNKGFDVFKIILDRKEVPDLYDINTALTSLAERHPRSAARIAERMIERGLKPDSVTVGTVVHHALLRKDLELVQDVVTQGSNSWGVNFDMKTISSLLRASVGKDFDVFGGSVRSRLEEAFDIITSLRGPNASIVSSPQMGKYMVYESLRAREFEIAFKFWNALLRGNAQWSDEEQVFIRRQIAKGIRKQGKSAKQNLRWMLRQLREPPKGT
ncbi:pentatricopeptide repeat-containing protein [Moniliophthora roreri MCA 2997]|uniref:Pentatricopeptide repeat-containing protein n=2 Tax=Moniliophthora roreri TaxID=221103 RepID=V2XSG8_MONRO|nr:pentatricopeptide repeat-containing protein [Moniliophthora roreri MCA 2997]